MKYFRGNFLNFDVMLFSNNCFIECFLHLKFRKSAVHAVDRSRSSALKTQQTKFARSTGRVAPHEELEAQYLVPWWRFRIIDAGTSLIFLSWQGQEFCKINQALSSSLWASGTLFIRQSSARRRRYKRRRLCG